ncbi:hypothetical protein [Dyella japonica]|uniref:Uncharacterized protein n=1 Tax=Dyella japonica A8 TaxID=1217721 RepID=A0A075K3V4_9GAMM|nr:hypothetical protein [Dyella japonica]AIF48735.1 hypothetical protein HY57_16550 [Dyella japonica A8]
MTQNTPYRPLPAGPVLCDDCSRAGAEVEMERQDALPPEARRWSREHDTALQSYRCPDCESIQVFRIG